MLPTESSAIRKLPEGSRHERQNGAPAELRSSRLSFGSFSVNHAWERVAAIRRPGERSGLSPAIGPVVAGTLGHFWERVASPNEPGEGPAYSAAMRPTSSTSRSTSSSVLYGASPARIRPPQSSSPSRSQMVVA